MAEPPDPTSSEPHLVGFKDTKSKIMNALLHPREQRRSVVAIVGPRGVGKTYLAKEIYTSAEVQKHFDVHIWVSAGYNSQKNSVLVQTREQISIMDVASISNFLIGERYCVVIDGFRTSTELQRMESDIFEMMLNALTNAVPKAIWAVALEEFPDNNNGSVVIITSRPESDFWRDDSVMQYEVGPRSDVESREMLLNVAGDQAGEGDDLVMEFVAKCGGLPWPLRFLRGLLSERPWNEVLNKIMDKEAAGMSFVDFAMRYRDLPHGRIRVAFLYFLTFPDDAEIRAKHFIHLLEIEGTSTRNNKDEEAETERYDERGISRNHQGSDPEHSRFRPKSFTPRGILEELAERSMIEVTKWYSDGSVKCCRLDPFFRCLAIHEAKERRFVWADDSCIVDLFDPSINFSFNIVKENHKFDRKLMDVAQLADASCIFNFGEKFFLETTLLSDRVLEIDDTINKADLARKIKKRGQLKYLGLNNLRLLLEIIEIKGWDKDLTTLVVRDTTIETLPPFELLKMRLLEHLSLKNTKVRVIPRITESLKTLDVRGTPIETLPEWIGSCKLICLILRNTKVSQIPKLSEFLRTLDIGGTPIETLPDASFFPNLITLVLKNTKVCEIPESFTKLAYLEDLDVRNTFVRSLPDLLWSKLRSVLASDTLQHLDGPPTLLKEKNKKFLGRGPRNEFTPKYDRLETLETVHVTRDWAESIPMFNWHLMRKLGLSYFQNDFTPNSALDWNIITRILKRADNLSSLKIQGSNIPTEIIQVETCPSYKKTLKNLSVGGSYSLFSLRGFKLPPFLITLRLDNLEFDQDPMPILEELNQLESLQLRWWLCTAQAKKMICTNRKFSKLKRLQLSHISGLEELSLQKEALPRITHVVIESCRDLKNLSDSLVQRKNPQQELHLNAMPTGFTSLFSGLPFVKITKNQI
ncbi:hypothetical protein LUZ63_000281 [Rhynchospora breviuscula]|uniref:NB-ARC domain-containing protein n=1 Tax=Rhynchospora breviuscula TaxID=2022672 RepID=A0A9Q0CUR0_9POAL|nr:hypothetical protein LUZ63_000281 [Rhynchospora breviuscula]